MELKACPSCRGTMEKGYIIAPAGMYWNEVIPGGLIHIMRKQKRIQYGLRFTRPSLGESICPSSDPRINWIRVKFPYLEGFRCKSCNLFIYSCRPEDDEYPVFDEKKPNGKILKCPSCHAQYFYLDSIIEQGIIRCQNCLNEFHAVPQDPI